MSQVARPLESSVEYVLGPGSSACGGSPWYQQTSITRKRYYDTDWKFRRDNFLPPLMMPYMAERTVVYSLPAPRPSGTPLVFFQHCFGAHNPGISTNQSVLRAQSRAASDLFNRIGDLDTFDLGLALAEGRKTIGLIANTATRIARSFRSLKRGNVKKAFEFIGLKDSKRLDPNKFGPNGVPLKYAGDHRRYLQNQYRRRDASRFAANSWLEMTYGWKPLLSDIDGAAEKLATMLQASDSDVTVRGFGEDIVKYENLTYNANHKGTFTSRCSWTVELKVIDDSLRLKTSLGLTNPASIAWELVPFSFVVDWFIPVGAWIDGLSVLNGYSIVAKSRSTTQTQIGESETTPTNSFVKSGHSAKLVMESRRIDRVTNVTPTLRSPFFDMGAKLSSSRLISALSLLKVVFGK